MTTKELNKHLAETYVLLDTDRVALQAKLQQNIAGNDWEIKAGLSNGYAADLKECEDRLFTKVMLPFLSTGVPLLYLLLNIRAFKGITLNRDISISFVRNFNEDDLLLLAKEYMDLDTTIAEGNYALIEQDIKQFQMAEDGQEPSLFQKIEELRERQAEIIYICALHGATSEDFRKAKNRYLSMSITEFLSLKERQN